MNTCLDGSPDPARIALEKPDRHDLGHSVVPGLVVTPHRGQRAVTVAVECDAGLGGEDLDPASLQDLHYVFGERPDQPRVLSLSLEPLTSRTS